MVLNCVAYGCSDVHDPNKAITFHTFPFKRPEILKLWIIAIRRDNWYPSVTSGIYGKHFLSTDFQNIPGSNRKLLKLDAVSSVFNFPKHLMKVTGSRKILSRHHVEEPKDMYFDPSIPSTYGLVSKRFVYAEVQTVENINLASFLQRKIKTVQQN